MEKNVRYAVPDSIEFQHLHNEISNRFITKTISVTKIGRQYFDTFDWRLYKAGLTFYQEKNFLHLAERSTGKQIVTERWLGNRCQKLCEELPKGQLRNTLAPVLEMRALQPLASAIAETTQLNILNRDRKSTIRLWLEKFYNMEKPLTVIYTSLTMKQVRGYPKEAKKFQKFADGLGLTSLDDDATFAIFTGTGYSPCSYSTKLNVQLTASQPASLAAVEIFKSQVKVMRLNEPGIKSDIDTEFLHDFRVALRRTRAGLSQFKGIFSPDITLKFKKELANIGKMTNRMRDLDVYLLKRDYYRTMLPEQLRPKLDHLFELLSAERNREKTKVIRKLNSAGYQNTMAGWEKFLDSYTSGNEDDGRNSSKPALALAKKFIFRTWSRTISKGRLIRQDTPDEELHRLRLDCKKLRYLLEFFFSLFPKKQMRFLIKQLRKLQDNLGDFNDICVQQETLQEYLEHQVPETRDVIDVAAAIGGLIANLNQKQQEVRQVFNNTFNTFDCSKNNLQFKKMFKN